GLSRHRVQGQPEGGRHTESHRVLVIGSDRWTRMKPNNCVMRSRSLPAKVRQKTRARSWRQAPSCGKLLSRHKQQHTFENVPTKWTAPCADGSIATSDSTSSSRVTAARSMR